MNKKLWASVLSLLVALSAIFFFKFFFLDKLEEREQALRAHETRAAVEDQDEVLRFESFQKKLMGSGDVSYWKNRVLELKNLSKENQKLLAPLVLVKLFEARAIERDNLLYYAGKLIVINENDPVAEEYFASARALHEENMLVIDTLPERTGDCLWNKRLWYRKGTEYYRSIIFSNPQEISKQLDLIDQAIASFEKVFSCYPKNRDTELAIELLYQRAKETKSAPTPAEKNEKKESLKEKIDLFPSEEIAPGTGKSMERGNKGRH